MTLLNVIRIDQNIPDFVFDILNENHGPERVHGAREFAKELALWIYPNIDETLLLSSKLQQPFQIRC